MTEEEPTPAKKEKSSPVVLVVFAVVVVLVWAYHPLRQVYDQFQTERQLRRAALWARAQVLSTRPTDDVAMCPAPFANEFRGTLAYVEMIPCSKLKELKESSHE